MEKDLELERARHSRVVSLAKKEGWAMKGAKAKSPTDFEPVERLPGKQAEMWKKANMYQLPYEKHNSHIRRR